jgi:hypothetical protein
MDEAFLRDVHEQFETASSEVAAAGFAIAIAISDLAYQLRSLGNGNASTQMGAIEALGAVLKEGFGALAYRK